jgi:hypothetical protein
MKDHSTKRNDRHGQRLILISAVLFCSSLSLAACVTETCKEKSPLVEMEVKLESIPLERAAVIEIESLVTTNAPTGEQAPSFRRRKIHHFPFPENARDGKITYLLDPGNYVKKHAALEELSYYNLLLIVRIYDQQNVLLGRGEWYEEMEPNGCHMHSMTVSADSQPQCDPTAEGKPCPAPDATDPSVCRPSEAEAADHDCRPSACSDGFTDVWRGELCDPAQTAWNGTCYENCLPKPVSMQVPAHKTDNAENEYMGNMYFETSSTDHLTMASPVPLLDGTDYPKANVLLSDLDGDSLQEMVVSFPGANDIDTTGVAAPLGQVMVVDRKLSKDTAVLDDNSAKTFVIGQPWSTDENKATLLGFSIASGDLDADGAQELAMGAPMAQEGKGAVYLLFGSSLTGVDSQTIRIGTHTNSYQGITAKEKNSYLGYQVALADFNGDGVSDIAASAPGPGPGPNAEGKGRVFLHISNPDRFGQGRSSLTFETDPEARTKVIVFELSESFSGSVTALGASLTAGDLDGDGFADLIMGTQTSSNPGEPPLGAAYVFFGGPHLSADSPTRAIQLDDPTTWTPDELVPIESAANEDRGLAGSLAVTDLDRDGAGDLALALGKHGTPISPHGLVVIPGHRFRALRNSSTTNPDTLMQNPLRILSQDSGPSGSQFASSLFAADINGDRTLDLAISAPKDTGDATSTTTRPGSVYFLLGSALANHTGEHADHTDPYIIENLISSDEPTDIPLIAAHGPTTEQWFGLAIGMSSHRSRSPEYKPTPDHAGIPNPPNPFTYILGLGPCRPKTQGSEECSNPSQHTATIQILRLNALLPCRFQPYCPLAKTQEEQKE